MMKTILLFGALVTATFGLNAQTIIFNETFDTPSGNLLAPNWSSQNLNNSGNSNYWSSGNSSATTGPMGFSGSTAISYGLSNSFDNLLISPAISLPTGASALTYKVGAYESSANGVTPNNTYDVYVLPASSTFTTTLTPIFTETITIGNTAFAKTIDISSFAGQSVKLYFRHHGTAVKLLVFDDVTVTSTMVLATSEVGNSNQVGIYPNPATDFIGIKSKSEVISTEIYDATGRKVCSQLRSDKIDVRNLQPGSYILNINTKEGKTSSKFIKKD